MKRFFLMTALLLTTGVSAKNFEFEAGINSYQHKYFEPGIMSEKGRLLGVKGSVSYHNSFFARLEAENGKGKIEYNGTGVTKGVPDNFYSYRGLIGKDLLRGNLRFTPYAGLGRRYLNDNSNNLISDTGGIGYERQSKYTYVPIGLEMKYQMFGWALNPSIEYDYFLEGEQTSYMGYLTPILAGNYYDFTNKQNDGRGFRASLKFIKDLPNKTSLAFEIFYRQWDIDDSTVWVSPDLTGWYEPQNRTRQLGVGMSVIF
ncbi:MAG: hypothetical protein JXQ74_02095 [Alphaproteobacteria bacterium]|nr:hypothetical protein [Alphaproteobacteria bacterium]